MKTFKTVFLRFSLVFLAALLMVSCSTGRKLARQYASNADSLSVLVLFPPSVFVVNKKQDVTQESFYFAETLSDTLLLQNSVLLPLLDDEQLLLPFQTAYLTEISRYGFKVYGAEKMDAFSSLNGYHYRLMSHRLRFRNTKLNMKTRFRLAMMCTPNRST